MRRTPGIVVALALSVAACSPSGGVTVSTDDPADPVSTESAPADRSDAGAGAGGDDRAGGASVDDQRRPVALPGLVDPSDEAVPDDAEVRTGTLDNGLRYYIRANDNPGGKAELRLAIAAGSVDELGRSTGTAHFVEHMLFNGTERFPENELIDVLRSFGAAFGADINAYTSYEETVYSLTVPNADESLEAGLTVLEQWLSHATFDPDQVIAERGVVLDEWRVRTQSAQGRLFDVADELFLAGTPYEGRGPIGDEASIGGMEAEELVAYYDAWYRPDNASVVVVGEIDVAEVEADISRLFGPATPRVEELPSRAATPFDIDTVPDFGLHADPDQQTVDVEITLPLPSYRSDGIAEVRAGIIDAMIFDAIVRRLSRDIAAGLAPFDRVTRGGNSFVDGLDAPAVYAFTDADRVEATLQALLDEFARAERFGFATDETDVAAETIRSFFRSRYDGRDSTQDREYADAYVEDFLRDSGFPDIEVEYEIVGAILDAVTPDALTQRFRARWDNSAPHVIISTPAAVADAMPARGDVLDAIEMLDRRELERRAAERDLPDSLMARPVPIEPGSIEELLGSGDPFLDPIELAYPNGVRVILNANGIVEGQVFLLAASPGGSSLVPDSDVTDALFAADIVTASGVAGFDQVELAQILAGSDVELDAAITPYLEQFVGSAATSDLEALLQLIHLYMTEPRFDPVALGQVRSRVGPVVADPTSNPNLAAQDALLDARYPGEPRYAVLPDPDDFATLDLDGVERVWTSRFGNSAGWVFVLSGDLDLDTAIDLASAYLGTLPIGADETWVDVEDPPPDGVVEVSVRAGTGDTASLTMLFSNPVAGVDERLRVAADVATEVVAARLTDVVREELGESYSPSATIRVTTDPDPVVETRISVTGAPGRIDQLAALVVDELGQLATEGPGPQEFVGAFAQVRERYNFVNNADFITELLNDAIHPALDIDDYLLEFAALDGVDARTVTEFLATHVRTDRFIEVTVLPR